MSLDQLFGDLAELPEQIRALTEQVEHLRRQVAALQLNDRAVYDAKALREMGVPHNETYRLLRERGSKTGDNGRYLITRDALETYMRERGSENRTAA